MKTAPLFAATCLAALLAAGAVDAQPVAHGDQPIIAVAETLAPGQYVWAPN
jgi:hypothetical protein